MTPRHLLRIAKELKSLASDPVEGFSLLYNPLNNPIQGFFIGPESTPYAGGLFSFTVQYPEDSLEQAPLVRVETPILHPGISQGQVCLLARWLPSRTLKWVLLQVKYMLQEPDFEDCVNLQAVRVFREGKFEQRARELTLASAH